MSTPRANLTWQHHAAEAYEPALQHAAEKAVFGGRDVPFYGWHYPPVFFVVAVIVAAIPYGWGLSIWLATSLLACLAAMRAILPRPETLLIAAAFPAVFVNIGHGQNGFSHHRAARWRAASARSPAVVGGRADRLAHL